MTVALSMLEIHLAEARSLKERRMVVNRLKGRLKSRFNVAVAETGELDKWQRATLAVVTVASDPDAARRILEQVEAEVAAELPGELLSAEVELLA